MRSRRQRSTSGIFRWRLPRSVRAQIGDVCGHRLGQTVALCRLTTLDAAAPYFRRQGSVFPARGTALVAPAASRRDISEPKWSEMRCVAAVHSSLSIRGLGWSFPRA